MKGLGLSEENKNNEDFDGISVFRPVNEDLKERAIKAFQRKIERVGIFMIGLGFGAIWTPLLIGHSSIVAAIVGAVIGFIGTSLVALSWI